MRTAWRQCSRSLLPHLRNSNRSSSSSSFARSNWESGSGSGGRPPGRGPASTRKRISCASSASCSAALEGSRQKRESRATGAAREPLHKSWTASFCPGLCRGFLGPQRDPRVEQPESDAVAIFGITGDLAYKKIIPALANLKRRGRLDMPFIGVAREGWTLERLRERITASLRENGDERCESTGKALADSLQYVAGDYREAGTFQRLREALGAAQT